MEGYFTPLKREESKYAVHFFEISRPAFQDRSKSAFFLISHMEKHRNVSMKTSGRF
jgi:ACT domain-containing protein